MQLKLAVSNISKVLLCILQSNIILCIVTALGKLINMEMSNIHPRYLI